MAISEKLTLLGAGLYAEKGIPDVITLKAIPTATELDYVGAEDFQATMLDTIFPKAIEEQFDYRSLLEIDFHWVCRCLRLLNYGPYYTTNAIYCPTCDQVSHGEYQVNLRSVDVKVLPNNFTNKITIPKTEFIEFNEDITIHLLTIQEAMNAAKDTFFADSSGDVNVPLARLCYMISSIGSKNSLTVIEKKKAVKEMISADFLILKDVAGNLADYGLRAGGKAMCPRCQSREAAFVALVDDRFFRPTLGNLRTWKADRNAQRTSESQTGTGESGRGDENLSGDAKATV